ncbi:DUF4932 domain-containing protein [Thalassotalea insulae]|nr:DUF4932 domain-containing protein [Thalassotalea insulae]
MRANIFIICFLAAIASMATCVARHIKQAEIVSVQLDKVRVSVDPRIELLSAIQVLSDEYGSSPLVTRFAHDYKQHMLEYFLPFKHHAAVQQFDRLVNKGFTFARPVTAMLLLDYMFNVDENLQFSPDILTDQYSETEVKQFLVLVKQFAQEAQFAEFYQSEQGLYRELVNQSASQIKGNSQIADLEVFYGTDKRSYNIVLAPNFHDGGFGPSIFTRDGGEHVYSVNGPTAMTKQRPDFGSSARTLELVNHEFSHSFLRTVFNEYKARINSSATLLAPIQQAMKKQGYGNWFSVLNEHVVRGVTTYIAYQQGKEQGDKALQYEKSRSYIYIEQVLHSLNNYQQQRAKYSTFNEYFATLLAEIEILANNTST